MLTLSLPTPPTSAPSHLSLAGYAPDTGRRHQYKDGKKLPGEKFLSYKKARIMGAQKHVGELRISSTTSSAKDTLVPFSLNAPFGAHDFDETSLCYKAPVCRPCRGCMIQGNSVLEPYGVGLVLYFKFLKYMTVVFLLMSFAVAPSISFFWLGSSFSTEDKGALMAESPLNALFLTTIGSLGSGTSSCAEATYGEVRSDEERSNELTTQSQATKTAHARTSVQDAPPPQPSQ